MRLITTTISAASALVLLLVGFWFQMGFSAVCFTTIMWLVIVIGFLLLAYSIINHRGNYHGVLYVIVLVLALIVLGIFVYPSKNGTIYTTWKDAKQCMLMNNICPRIPKSPISPIQEACCIPPLVCGYSLDSYIIWTNMTNPGGSEDCPRWSNEGDILCLNCESCKLELLNGFKKRWGKGKFFAIIAVILFIVSNIFDYFCGRKNPVAQFEGNVGAITFLE
ncbi:hypothetical protein ACHQM5_002974 [Ranunculus cassubicifolius]